jgi:dTDP-4-amino-4,6-dideoxygalactose transaminase
MDTTFIPFHRPSIGNEERTAVREVLESDWLTTGPVSLKFEREFAQYLGAKHALAVNSGTAALQLAANVIGLQPGDEVLTPSFTFTATAEVATYFGARPVLCDSVAGGFNLDVADAERRITPKTKAIIPVHVGGEPCDLDAIHAMASRHQLQVIEDAAHALPATFRGKRIGTCSAFTAFSFYATKNITTGEGGMLVTDREDYAEKARCMRLHGISSGAWKRYSREGTWFYEVLHAGFKLNLPDILSAVGLAQLSKADQFMRRRRQIALRYCERLARTEELELPPAVGSDCEHSWHLFVLRLRPGALRIGRNEFIEELKKLGIGVSVHFIPLHLHPYYAQTYAYKPGDFPKAEDAFSRCLSLPIYPSLSDDEVDRVIRTVEHLVRTHRHTVAAVA